MKAFSANLQVSRRVGQPSALSLIHSWFIITCNFLLDLDYMMGSDNKESSNDTSGNSVVNPLELWKDMKKNIPFSLKDGIKSGVQATNSVLAEIEHQTDTVSTGFVSRVRPLYNQVSYYVQRSIQYYEMREYYGPQIIGGTIVSIGSIVGLRRGKIPAAFTSAFGGVGAGFFVYGLPDINKE